MEKVAAPGLVLGALLVLLTMPLVWAQARRGTVSSTKRPTVVISRDYKTERVTQTQTTIPTGPIVSLPHLPRLIEMSFRFAPSFSYNTAEGAGTYGQFQDNGVGIRLSLGPSIDYFFFRDRYAFSSGLWYTIKRSSFVMPGSFGQDVFRPGQAPGVSVYNLQYLQIPLTLKLLANEISPTMRAYVQCGGILDIKLAEKPLDQLTNPLYKYAVSGGSYRRQYGFADVGILLGAGVQYRINQTNALNMGLSYQRGLISVFRDEALESRNSTIAIDLGFKF